MIGIIKNDFSLSALINKMPSSSTTKTSWQQLVESWDLTAWEDNLFYQLLYFIDLEQMPALDYARNLFEITRSKNAVIKDLTPPEIKQLSVEPKLLLDDNFQDRLLKTVYDIINLNYNSLGVSLVGEFDRILWDEESKFALAGEALNFYRTIYTILALNHFDLLLPASQNLIFGGSILPLAMRFGFDLDTIVKQTVDPLVSFYNRRNLCLDLAAFMTVNEAHINDERSVEPANIESINIKDLIVLFRNYSKNNFSGTDMINFFNDPDYAKDFGSGGKDIARQILELYIRLTNGSYVVPDGDFTALDKKIKELESEEAKVTNTPVAVPSPRPSLPKAKASAPSFSEIRQSIDGKYQKDEAGQFIDVDKVLSELGELAIKYNNPKIAEMLYFDEVKGKFIWTE